jgi:hypothetical protein
VAERDELERIYEATWMELENAIGSKAAEAIRKSVEKRRRRGRSNSICRWRRRDISIWKEKQDATSKRG